MIIIFLVKHIHYLFHITYRQRDDDLTFRCEPTCTAKNDDGS